MGKGKTKIMSTMYYKLKKLLNNCTKNNNSHNVYTSTKYN